MHDSKSALNRGKLASFPHSQRLALIAMAPVDGKLIPTNNTAVYIVTGGNRGLGIEHVKQFLEKTAAKVIATARQPTKTNELNTLSKKYADRLSVIELDTGSESSIEVYHMRVPSREVETFGRPLLFDDPCGWIWETQRQQLVGTVGCRKASIQLAS